LLSVAAVVVLPLLCTVALIPVVVRAEAIETGKPHSTVQILTDDNVDDALNDPANGLWLLKFYAPWCGHCKKLTPTLNLMAPYLSGKLAIGKIDCTDTSARPICDAHSIKGYPTLKIYRDGNFFDYPGKRDADSMIEFAEKMSRPAVAVVETYRGALSLVGATDPRTGGGGTGDGVVFVAYDNRAAADSGATFGDDDAGVKALEGLLASTTGLQVFGQVARKLQAEAAFTVLRPGVPPAELEKFGAAPTDGGAREGAVLMKVEENVPTLVYDGPLSSPEFMDFVREHNIPLITELAGNNFRAVSKRGRPLAIAVVDGEDTVATGAYIEQAREYAQNGPHRAKYIFCRMDGRTWSSFLDQFPVDPDDLPSILLLDSPNKKYWHNRTVSNEIGGFLEAVEEGTVEVQVLNQRRRGGFMASMADYVEDHLFVVVVSMCIAVCILSYLAIIGSREDEKDRASAKKRN